MPTHSNTVDSCQPCTLWWHGPVCPWHYCRSCQKLPFEASVYVFLGIAGGPRGGSEDVDSLAGGFVSVALGVLDGVATGVLDGVPLGVFDGIAPSFVSITGDLDGASGEVEWGVGWVSRELRSLALGLELPGFSCSDSRVTPTRWGAGAGAEVGAMWDIRMDCCMWRDCSVRYCMNSRWHGISAASVRISTISIWHWTQMGLRPWMGDLVEWMAFVFVTQAAQCLIGKIMNLLV